MKERALDRDNNKKQKKENFLVSIVWIIFLALLFRSFAFGSYNIPSGSMLRTLHEGDYIFVSKWAYGYSRHSLPFSIPIIPNRLFANKPERGDVAVFKLPTDNRTDYIKRIIGLPGDTVQIVNGQVILNGKTLEYNYKEDYQVNRFKSPRKTSQGCLNEKTIVYEEILPNGVSYEILNTFDNLPQDNTPVYRVPKDHYFLMGDNRDNSQDSRFLKKVGFVPFENLVGQAGIIFFSWHWKKVGKNFCLSNVKWNRAFKLIK